MTKEHDRPAADAILKAQAIGLIEALKNPGVTIQTVEINSSDTDVEFLVRFRLTPATVETGDRRLKQTTGRLERDGAKLMFTTKAGVTVPVIWPSWALGEELFGRDVNIGIIIPASGEAVQLEWVELPSAAQDDDALVAGGIVRGADE